MSDNPLVSIILPCFQHERYVEESILSCFNQTYKNIQLIISDDCSTDDTKKIIKNIIKNPPFEVLFLDNKVNIGINKNMNQSIKMAKGKYISFHSGDDIFLAKKIESQVGFMETHPECNISYHDVSLFSDHTKRVLYDFSDRYKPLDGDYKTVIKNGIFFSALGCMVRSGSLPPGGFDENVEMCSDWFLMAETLINSGGTIKYLPGVYAYNRQHNFSITSKNKTQLTDYEHKSLDCLLKKYDIPKEYVNYRRSSLFFIKFVRTFFSDQFFRSFKYLNFSFRYSNGLWVAPFLIFREIYWRILCVIRLLGLRK